MGEGWGEGNRFPHQTLIKVPLMSRLPWLTFLLTLPAVLLLHPSLAAAFQYDRSLVHGPDLVRFLTCQWTHWSVNHFAWDVLVFAALGIIIESKSRVALVVTIATSALAVPVAVHLFCPSLTHFRGLSGIGTAMVGYLISTSLVDAARARRVRTVALCAAGIVLMVVKTAVELATHRPIFVQADAFVVVPVAHGVGFVVGAFLAIAAIPASRIIQAIRWRHRCRRTARRTDADTRPASFPSAA